MSGPRACAGTSVRDLDVFFAPHHAAVASRAEALANAWTPSGADEHAATRAAVAALATAGLNAFAVPEAHGGAAVGRPEQVDVRALTLIREALAQADGLLDTAFAMQGLGSFPISAAGTPAQRARYLPGIIDGRRLGAFALTEPDAGSDVAALACRATPRADGGYTLSGTKTFISNAGVATQYVVFATVDPALGRRGITAFLVEPDDAGLTVEPFEVIAPHPIGTLRLADVQLPADRLLGAVGEGFALAMRTLDTFRTTVGGAALGMARRAQDEALRHALARRQFGGPIFDRQQVAAALADSATELDAARLLVYRAAHRCDTSADRPSTEVAMGKLFATEAAARIIDRAVQIHGGLGVTRGVAVERLYREIRALRIYEGTTEIQRVIIAAGLRRAVTVT